jgi:hypothetical protein
MRHGTATLVCVCLSLFGARFTAAEDQDYDRVYGRLHRGDIVFRCVKTRSAPMIEMKTSNAVFLVPRLKALPGAWYGEGELRLEGQRVEWIGKNGTTMSGADWLVNPLVATKGSGKSDTATSLQSVTTPNGRMVEIKICGAVALAPYLVLIDGRKAVEIRPIDDKLRYSDGKSTATFTSMSFDP